MKSLLIVFAALLALVGSPALAASDIPDASAAARDANPPMSIETRAELDARKQRLETMENQVEAEFKSVGLTYQGLPRKKFVTFGKTAVYQKYVDSCMEQITTYINGHYPDEARNKLYGKGVATLELDPEGKVLNAMIDISTGHALLDQTFLDGIRAAAPYPPFPEEIRREADIVSITRSFSYDHVDD